jgi:hypothetical protein
MAGTLSRLWGEMSTAVQPNLFDRVHAHRDTKRSQIERYFVNNIGLVISSRALHMKFGSAVRTRISEINRDKFSPIRIENDVVFTECQEQSSYWAVRR